MINGVLCAVSAEKFIGVKFCWTGVTCDERALLGGAERFGLE
jgi:hypothetical protein